MDVCTHSVAGTKTVSCAGESRWTNDLERVSGGITEAELLPCAKRMRVLHLRERSSSTLTRYHMMQVESRSAPPPHPSL